MSSSSVVEARAKARAHARELAVALAHQWGVVDAEFVIATYGRSLVAATLKKLNRLRFAGKLPQLRNPSGYCMATLRAASEELRRRRLQVPADFTPANPTPPTASHPVDPLDAYRRAYGRYVKSNDRPADASSEETP